MSKPDTASPTPLLDDPSLGAALRHDLEAAKAASRPYDASAGLARFEATLASGAPAAPLRPPGAATRVLGWIVGAAVLVGGGVAAGDLLRGSDAPKVQVAAGSGPAAARVRDGDLPVAGVQSPDAGEAAPAPRARESVAEVGVREGAGDAGSAPAQAEGDSPALDASTPPRPASKPKSATAEDAPEALPSLADEARLINAARKALAKDPAEALALVQEAQQRFPEGAMIQERRGYEVLALVALGRGDEAQTKGASYLERWPKGTLSSRVRAALEGE